MDAVSSGSIDPGMSRIDALPASQGNSHTWREPNKQLARFIIHWLSGVRWAALPVWRQKVGRLVRGQVAGRAGRATPTASLATTGTNAIRAGSPRRGGHHVNCEAPRCHRSAEDIWKENRGFSWVSNVQRGKRVESARRRCSTILNNSMPAQDRRSSRRHSFSGQWIQQRDNIAAAHFVNRASTSG